MSRAWMPLYVGDFLADTMDLNATETGIYIRLIMHCWQHGQIPADPQKLARICNCDAKIWWRYCNILRFFDFKSSELGTCYVHNRVTKERTCYEEKRRKNKAAAQKMHAFRTTQSQSFKNLTSSSIGTARAKENPPLIISEHLLKHEEKKRNVR